MFSRRVLLVGIVVFLGLTITIEPVQAGGYDCTSDQTQIPVDECWALVDLYSNTNGSGWTDNTGWLSTLSAPCYWHGITCSSGHVSQVNLFNNNLTGTLPSSLSDLTNIHNLYLNANNISGSIPTSLGSLSTLWRLALAGNDLTGSIPSELGNMSSLEILELSNNLLTGGVPSELANLSNLEELYLNTNSLTGAIPLAFTNMTALLEFTFGNTSLCEPPVDSYRTWKAGITTYTGTSECSTSNLYYRSVMGYDGFVTERTEAANAGMLTDRLSTTIDLGDTNLDQQNKGILHFNTATIPDNAVITKVTLRAKQSSITGTNPYTTHGYLIVDIEQPYFGTLASLQPIDFQDTSSMNVACTLRQTSTGWYLGNLKTTAFQYINKTGITQFRLRFQVGDNDDMSADLLKFWSGDAGVASFRPIIMVQYYVP